MTVVSGLSPASGPNGTLVLITGSGFTDASDVVFGSVDAGLAYTVVSDTSIAVYAPAGTGTVDVVVTSPAGTSTTSSADQWTYAAAPGPSGGGGTTTAPVVNSLTPTSGAPAGGTQVTISGMGYTAATDVSFGTSPATFVINSDLSITATSPAGSGVVDVTVTNAYGTSTTSSSDQFTYTGEAAPTVTAISPTGGMAGDTITITGTGFADATAVEFGTSAATFVLGTDTTLTAVVPAGSGSVDVTVVGPGGTSTTSSADVFTYGAPATPVTTATHLQPNAFTGWTTGPVTVALSCIADAAGTAGTYYTTDLNGMTPYGNPFTISAAGSHMVTYWSVDNNGVAETVHIGWVNILSTSLVPSGLTATPAGTGAVLLAWTPLANITQVTYRVYSGTANPPTTLVQQTAANVLSVPQPSTQAGTYYAVSSVDVSGNESAKCTAVGPVTSYKIVGTDITPLSITSPLIAANTITGDNIHSSVSLTSPIITGTTITGATINGTVSINAPTITGGNISAVNITGSSTITGAMIQTGSTGQRVALAAHGSLYGDSMVCYDVNGNVAGVVTGFNAGGTGAVIIDWYASGSLAGQMTIGGAQSSLGNSLSVNGYVAATSYVSAASLTVSGLATLQGGATVTGNISATGAVSAASLTVSGSITSTGTLHVSGGGLQVDAGNIAMSGSVRSTTNYSSYASDDGILIQDSAASGYRWKLFYNSTTNKLYVGGVSAYGGSGTHYVSMT